jgi:hypothetical protein
MVAIARPRLDATVNGTVTIRVAARDDQDSGSQLRVFVAVGGQGILPAPYDPVTQLYNAVWDTGALSDGPYVLQAFVVDSTGNRSASRKIRVTVDNYSPFW